MRRCTISTSLIARAPLAAAALVLALSGQSAPVIAAEQIVLPFECTLAGGRVQMRPSEDQAYRIYGTRRQEPYRACSEVNPDRCRTFIVHRFTMACGRDRAEWADVYAAIAKVTDGRAFYNNDGRLYYRMGPREPRDSYPFPEPRRAAGLVEMPDGFAPMAGVDAIFTPLDPRVAELDDTPPQPVEPAEKAPPAATAKANAPKIVEAPKPPPPEKAPEPPPVETAATSVSPPAPAEPLQPDAGKSDASGAPAPVAKTPEAPVAPTILNNPVAKEVEQASKSETVVAAAEITPPKQAAVPEPGARVEGWSATGPSGLQVSPLVIAVLIAGATFFALLVILKKQSEATVMAGPLRMPIEPSLPGLDPPVSATGQALTLRPEAGPPAPSQANFAQSGGMPSTREDALAALGLNTGATEAVIRKVVEGLRQSWHPDLAADDADRAAREERIKAINASADILLRKTAA